jgi:hypothetical protein
MYELVHLGVEGLDLSSLSLHQEGWTKGFDFIDPRVQSLLPLLQYDDRRVGLLAISTIAAVAFVAFFILVLVQPYSTYERVCLSLVTLGIQPLLPIAILAYFKVSDLLRDVQKTDSVVSVVAAAVKTQCHSLLFWMRFHEICVSATMAGILLMLHLPIETGSGYIGSYPFTAIMLLYPLPFYGTGIARWRIALPLIWVCTVMALLPVAKEFTPWDYPSTRHRKIVMACWTGVVATVIYICRQIGLRDALKEILVTKRSIASLGKQRDDLGLLVASALPERVRTCAWEQATKNEADGQQSITTLAVLDVPSSVVFGDVVGFTKWCSKRSVMEIVSMLSSLFDELDRVAASVGI